MTDYSAVKKRMNMNHVLQEWLVRCRRELESHPDHLLSFATRRAMLLKLGPLMPDARGFGRELGVGKRRRLELAWWCASQVVPVWESTFGDRAPCDLLHLVRGYLDGGVTLEAVKAATDAQQGRLGNSPQGKDAAYLACRAMVACGWVAVGDELLVPDAGVSDEELKESQDPDLWDPAFLAAAALAGGIPGTPHFSRNRMLELWTWYLDIAVPGVCRLVR